MIQGRLARASCIHRKWESTLTSCARTWRGSRSGMASMRKGKAKVASLSGAPGVTDSDRYARDSELLTGMREHPTSTPQK